MAKFSSPLDGVRVAAPCKAAWERMAGDERVRFCGECRMRVYNLSGITRREAEALVTNAEGRLCVRFYRRADGTILTRNCPAGLRALKQRVSRVAASALSAALGFFAGLGLVPTRGPVRHVMGGMAVPSAPGRNYEPTAPRGEEEAVPYVQAVGMLAVQPRPEVGELRRSDDEADSAAPPARRRARRAR